MNIPIPKRSKVFVSYRRSDNFRAAQNVAEALKRSFGRGQVFFDIHDIQGGTDFSERLRKQLEATSHLIVVVGKRWLQEDEKGVSRLEGPSDWVRIEILSALSAGISVFQALIDDAQPLSEANLPAELAPLARRQAVYLRNLTFRRDLDHLIWEIRGRPARLRDFVRDIGLAIESPGRFINDSFLYAWPASIAFLVALALYAVTLLFPLSAILFAPVGAVVAFLGSVFEQGSWNFDHGHGFGAILFGVVVATMAGLQLPGAKAGTGMPHRLIVSIWLGILCGAIAKVNSIDQALGLHLSLGQYVACCICLTVSVALLPVEPTIRLIHWAWEVYIGIAKLLTFRGK
jgi:TIR domain